MSLTELKKDSEELAKFLSESQRKRVKDALTTVKRDIDLEIINLEIKAKAAAEKSNDTNSDETQTKKRYLVELSEYAWDQSDKFVKMFVTLDGVENVEEENVIVDFTSNSMKLLIQNMNGKDYSLIVNNLLENIDVEKSYRKIKSGMIAIYMKKVKESEKWSHLTCVEKRIKDKKDAELAPEADAGEDAVVNLLKKMFNTGDAKTKQMIAKAWTESQEKRSSGDLDFKS